MATPRRAAQPPRDDIAVASELVLLREILTRVEEKLDEYVIKTDGHEKQIDRWKTVGAAMTPVLLGLGVLANKAFDWLMLWFGNRVHP